MSKFLGEFMDVKGAIIMAGGSSANSQPFSLRDVSRVTVLCQINNPQSSVLATAASPCTVSVVVGTAAEVSAMTLLTGATLEMGNATVTQLNKWEAVCIAAMGTLATGRSIVIDGTTFTVQANASLADKQLSASACSLFTDALASAIATFCTHLETYGQVTAGNATATSLIYIRRKDYGPGMSKSIDVSATVNSASSDCAYIQGIKQCGVIEFRPANVLATNSSYTHFGIRVNQATTTQNVAISVIRETGYQSTNTKRLEI